jgi:hypothetical protein
LPKEAKIMRHLPPAVFVMLTSIAVAAPSAATEQPDTPLARDSMVKVLTGVGQYGQCDEKFMDQALANSCEQQIQSNIALLQPLGKITNVTYEGLKPVNPSGNKLEAYTVEFEHGTMEWWARMGNSGKLESLWSNAKVAPR